MNDQRREKVLSSAEAELLKMEAELSALRTEHAELKTREEQYINTIKEQGQELEQLHRLARVVRNHFEDFFNTGCHVERCVACSKCDYEILGQALLPFKDFGK